MATPYSDVAAATATATADSSGRAGASGRFDLLDVEVGADKQTVKVLGSENPRLPSVDDLSVAGPDLGGLAGTLDSGLTKLPSLDRLPMDDLSIPERAEVLEALKKLDEKARPLIDERSKGDLTDERKAAIDKGLRELKQKKTEILREKLGMSDEDIERWYDQNESEEK
jgi:hypothetical protein